MKRLKWAGRGHDPGGVKVTGQGECAMLCWACPHDGINLPSNWRDVDDRYKYVSNYYYPLDLMLMPLSDSYSC